MRKNRTSRYQHFGLISPGFRYLVTGCLICLLTACVNHAPVTPSVQQQIASVPAQADKAESEVAELKQQMLGMIQDSINQDSEMSPELKTRLTAQAIEPLQEESAIFLTGEDKITRPVAVNLQKAFEQTLVELGNSHHPGLTRAVAIIHTDKPTTPLCNPQKQILPGTAASDMSQDAQRLKTITDRSITVRKMARCGGNLSLVIAYARDGLEKRTAAEKQVYLQETLKPENCNLTDARLNCDAVPAEISGSSYILTTPSGGELYFGNNGMQALESSKNMYWRYWFGSTKKIVPARRKQEIEDFLKTSGYKPTGF
ncbi:hypothetical protein ACWJJH_00965 [Endozoicomonadaceae bacterium StTr2]